VTSSAAAQPSTGKIAGTWPSWDLFSTMRSSLSLQRSLYAHQKRQIGALVQSASKTFQAYERRYHRATRRFRRVIDSREVLARLRRTDIVYVGDYHTLRLAQQTYLELVEAVCAGERRVVLALEFIEGRSQAALDAYLAGRLGEKAFLARIGHPYRGDFDIWPSFREILSFAKQQGLEVVAIDRRAPGGPRSLEVRDGFAARRIAELARAPDRPLVMVLMGQFHVAPEHLPARVTKLLGSIARAHQIVYQNAEGLWWRLAERGLAGEARAVELDEHQLCVFSASPVVCQRSFLDYVEAESGDAPIDERGLTRTVRVMMRDIARLTRVRLGALPSSLEVITAAELEVMRRIVRRAEGPARFTPDEVRHLERHVLSRESAFIPRARVVWLASLSLNHAAEEAAHAVRFAVLGASMDRARPRADAFWTRVFEEALGFFGSRLVNPARQCTTLTEWAAIFGDPRSPHHRTAAFVLALHVALLEGPAAARALIPPTLEAFNATAHALGYLLGDALARSFSARRVTGDEVTALFHDRLENPGASVLALRQLVAPMMENQGRSRGEEKTHRAPLL
jgi:uncharacterized iron-regulated protein